MYSINQHQHSHEICKRRSVVSGEEHLQRRSVPCSWPPYISRPYNNISRDTNSLEHFLKPFKILVRPHEILTIQVTVSNLVHDVFCFRVTIQPASTIISLTVAICEEKNTVAVQWNSASLSLSADHPASHKTLCILMVHQETSLH